MQYAIEFTRKSFVLRGDAIVPVGRTYYEDVKKSFIDYMTDIITI